MKKKFFQNPHKFVISYFGLLFNLEFQDICQIPESFKILNYFQNCRHVTNLKLAGRCSWWHWSLPFSNFASVQAPIVLYFEVQIGCISFIQIRLHLWLQIDLHLRSGSMNLVWGRNDRCCFCDALGAVQTDLKCNLKVINTIFYATIILITSDSFRLLIVPPLCKMAPLFVILSFESKFTAGSTLI